MAALLPFLGACRSGPPARAPEVVPPRRVFVRLEAVEREHPAHVVQRWSQSPSPIASPSIPTSVPLRAGRLSLDLARRATADEPLTPLYPAQRERARAEERAAIDATFARARVRESSTARYYAEERQLVLEDELEKLRARSRARLEEDLERERLATAEAMSRMRQLQLRVSALETPAEAARRRATVEADMQKLRDQLAATNRRLEQQHREQLEREERAARAAAARDIASTEERQRAAPLPDHEAQRRLLADDSARPAPAPLPADPPPPRPATPALVEKTALEPALATARGSARATPNQSLLDEWMREETTALIRQWARLHHYELTGLSRDEGARDGAVDRTAECLSWLRANAWKAGPS